MSDALGDRANALYARLLGARRQLLVGELEAAEQTLAAVDDAGAPPPWPAPSSPAPSSRSAASGSPTPPPRSAAPTPPPSPPASRPWSPRSARPGVPCRRPRRA